VPTTGFEEIEKGGEMFPAYVSFYAVVLVAALGEDHDVFQEFK
jgi:hypothetical protein